MAEDSGKKALDVEASREMSKGEGGPAKPARESAKPVREPWIIRTYAGFGDAVQANRRFLNNLKEGQRGLSIAFDLPTQNG